MSNPKYAFELHRKIDRPWLLKKIELAGEKVLDEQASPKLNVERVTLRPISLSTSESQLPTFIRRPGFRAIAGREREGGLVEIDFVNPHPVPTDRADPIQAGRILLDPANSWCVRRCSLDCEDVIGKHLNTVHIVYRQASGPFLIPLRIEMGGKAAPGAAKRSAWTSVHECDFAVPASPPPVEEFTLTAFGLPEPPGIIWKRPTPIYLWLLLAAGFCGAAAFLFRWLASRKAEPTVTEAKP